MKEYESPTCEALRQAAENDGGCEYVEAPTASWFHPPHPVEGDEPLSVEASELTDAMRRGGLI